MTVGFMIRENEGQIKHSTDLLTKLGAPLEDKKVAHHYLITTEGEAINLNQLIADLASNSKVSTVLIHDPPVDMNYLKALEIQEGHLHPSARGKNGFLLDNMNTDGQTRVCYWPLGVTVSDLHKDVMKARQKDRRLMVQLPQHGNSLGYMWSFTNNTRMARVGHIAESEMTIEYRSAR